MSHIKKLEKLVKNDIMLEVTSELEGIESKLIKITTKELKDELDYMLQVQQYFDELLEDIKLGNLTEKDALDILESLEDMRIDNEDDI